MVRYYNIILYHIDFYYSCIIEHFLDIYYIIVWYWCIIISNLFLNYNFRPINQISFMVDMKYWFLSSIWYINRSSLNTISNIQVYITYYFRIAKYITKSSYILRYGNIYVIYWDLLIINYLTSCDQCINNTNLHI